MRWPFSDQTEVLSGKRGKCDGVVDGVVGGVVDPVMFRGCNAVAARSLRCHCAAPPRLRLALRLAEGRRGLCRAQPVTHQEAVDDTGHLADGSGHAELGLLVEGDQRRSGLADGVYELEETVGELGRLETVGRGKEKQFVALEEWKCGSLGGHKRWNKPRRRAAGRSAQ